MILDEAIKHAEEIAESRCDECGREHRQLVEWLKELKEYKEQEPCEDAVSIDVIIEWLKSKDLIGLSSQEKNARKELQALVSVQTKQECEDAVSREELLKAIDTWDKFGYTETGCFVREPKGDYVPYIHYDDVIKSIKGMPSVQPKPKTGHWINTGIDEEWYARAYGCSLCGHTMVGKDKYCPNCGCRMVEPQESEDNG